MFVYVCICTKFTNQSICLENRECASCWHLLLLPIITPFYFSQQQHGFRSGANSPVLFLLLSLFHHFIITVSASLDFRLACLFLRVFQRGRAPQYFLPKNNCLIFFRYVRRTTFSNGRIHFRNAWRYVLGEVVQKEPADVEERLWHVGTEGLILEIKTVQKK